MIIGLYVFCFFFCLFVFSGFLDRLKDGEYILCAEGYLFQFERRGYLKAGAFVPEVVLEHPELVRQQYEEYVHAGSDVVLAFTVRFSSLNNRLRRFTNCNYMTKIVVGVYCT